MSRYSLDIVPTLDNIYKTTDCAIGMCTSCYDEYYGRYPKLPVLFNVNPVLLKWHSDCEICSEAKADWFVYKSKEDQNVDYALIS